MMGSSEIDMFNNNIMDKKHLQVCHISVSNTRSEDNSVDQEENVHTCLMKGSYHGNNTSK